MVNVIVVSDVLTDGEYLFNPREFPEAPQIGDYISILSFVKSTVEKDLAVYLKSKNKISLGRVDSRSWEYHEGKLSLFVTLDFEDIDNEDSVDGYFN